MSIQSCEDFVRAASDSPELARELRAVTRVEEIITLGRRHGYAFSAADLMQGPPAPGPPAPRSGGSPARTETAFYHHEYALADLPGFEAVAAELPALEVKPPSVDLDQFDRAFREDDLRTTSSSPLDPAFRAWHEDLVRPRWGGTEVDGPRRDFHLVNLDEHVDHPGYDRYFAAKTRVIAALEAVFGREVRFSGSLWYPPNSYRLWHTNEDQPGWRMYVVDLDAPFGDPAHTSFFRYVNPATGEIVTLRERPRIVRFFKAEQEPTRRFWHCIVNPTDRHRWSFGFVVPDDWMDRLGRGSC